MPSKRSGLQERIARRRGAIIASEMSRGANVCFSTEQIAESHRRVLIVGTNKRVRRIARSVHNAGLTVVLPYTTDMARSTRISGIDQAVCVGEKYLPGVTEELLECIDVLVDGAFREELHDITLRFRGSSNQRIIDVPATLARLREGVDPEQAVAPWKDDPVFATHTME